MTYIHDNIMVALATLDNHEQAITTGIERLRGCIDEAGMHNEVAEPVSAAMNASLNKIAYPRANLHAIRQIH